MSIHKPALLKEVIERLKLKKDSIVVDATFGGGGHSQAILDKIGDKGKLIAIDADSEAIERFKLKAKSEKLKVKGRIFLINDNFTNLENILETLKIEKIDAILADLGWSSDQLKGKGMSFQKEEELDMRLSKNQKISAKDVVNNYDRRELERIIREYGEEKFWKNISRKISDYRKNKKIETTKELAEIIREAIPEKYRFGKLNLATKTFQAIRIEVNRELENLEKFIPQAIKTLKPKGRLAIISFHSLEDRIVKNSFKENARGCICPANFPQCVCGNKPKILVITGKPVIPKDLEIKINPNSRSAKLRVCEKI